jgi:ABC-type uncharacterized transport system permease subunit
MLHSSVGVCPVEVGFIIVKNDLNILMINVLVFIEGPLAFWFVG